MSIFRIKIPYTPKAKASVRTGKYGHYNPSSRGMLQCQSYVREHLKDYKLPLMTGPLLVICHFLIPVPRHVKKLKRAKDHLLPHTKRPDGDNLEKFLNDSLNGIIWDDDSKITWLLRTKTLTAEMEGSTTIVVRELANEPLDYDLILETIKEHIYIGKDDAN